MTVPDFPRCDRTPAWAELQALAARGPVDARAGLARDPSRAARLSLQAPHVFADWSKQRTDAAIDDALLALAAQCGVEAQCDAMLRGDAVNHTEGRAVGHVWLRNGPETSAWIARPAIEDVAKVREAMLVFAERVRADSAITDIVNIGIGGSDLGPQMAVLALEAERTPGKRFHFVSNVDGHELHGVLERLRPESTLFLVASKTFTTLETMANAASARAWFQQQGGTDVARHFVGLTTNLDAARAFGIETTFGFWDWVGGRYSLWSAIGLPIAIAVGAESFRRFLAGAADMDAHFATAPAAQNLPVRLALLDVWNRNFCGFTSRCVAPYHAGLRRLPAYLQQLEMESNGKRVGHDGAVLPYATSPVVWGEPGTNGQHAFFQMLHQGTDVVPVEFIAVRDAAHPLPGHQQLLNANALAQAQALLEGRADAGGHKDFPGNRPSTFFVLERLSPESLGALIALYEHRTFCAGALWGINSFDQWGVELGKVLAQAIAPRLERGDAAGLDASTAQLLARLHTPS